MYLPTLTPALSTGFVWSSIKIVSSAKASTSYHLLFVAVKNSWNVGVPGYDVPSFCIMALTPNTFLSGKNKLKNGTASTGFITFLNTLVKPLTTTSLFVIT